MTEWQKDHDLNHNPYVVVKAHYSRISGWIPSFHSHHKTRNAARLAAEELHRITKVFVRVEKWRRHDGHLCQVLDEFGVKPETLDCESRLRDF